MYYFFRKVRDLFEEVRERCMRAIYFAKNLRKEYEPAMGFSFKIVDLLHSGKKKQRLVNFFSADVEIY